MKDSYDFSGAPRGKFFRPNARVKLPYERGSQSWLVDVATTGRWWQPEFWQEPQYLATSPWSETRIAEAIEALIAVYTPDVTRTAFAWVLMTDSVAQGRAIEHPAWRLLACSMFPAHSALLRLGFDLVDASALSDEVLVSGLRSSDSSELAHARFLCRCLAAFRNAQFSVHSHPSSAPGFEPDLRIDLDDGPLYVEAKRSGESARIKEEQAWFWKLLTARGHFGDIQAQITLTSKYEELQNTDEGRDFLRANIERLASELAAAKERIAREGSSFPSTVSIDGLVELNVFGVTQRNASGFLGVPTDGRREASRIVRSAVIRGAEQLPPNERGLICLDPGIHVPSHLLVDEIQRWMRTDGDRFPHLVGVLVNVESLMEPMPGLIGRVEQLLPVWRENAPRSVTSGAWDRVAGMFAAHDLEILAHRANGSGESDLAAVAG